MTLYWPNANVVWAGNSLVFGTGSTGGQNLPTQTAALKPMNGLAFTNLGVAGQPWSTMITNGASVDSLYNTKKHNVLIAWEGTNQMRDTIGNSTAAVAYGMAVTWTAARLAAHPEWKIVHMTCLPRFASSAQCQRLVDYNTLLTAGWASMGASALVDVRSIPEFNFFGTDQAAFDGNPLWADYIHLTNAGYALVAPKVAAQLETLPGSAGLTSGARRRFVSAGRRPVRA